jgi:hypothetical protein
MIAETWAAEGAVETTKAEPGGCVAIHHAIARLAMKDFPRSWALWTAV